jgi:hypothetical protein
MTGACAVKGIDRYLRLMHWARKRYTDDRGRLTISIGGATSIFSRIELAAARKFMKLS